MDPQVLMMRNFFTQPQTVVLHDPIASDDRVASAPSNASVLTQCGYLSDITTNSEESDTDSNGHDSDHGIEDSGLEVRTCSVAVESVSTGRLVAAHPLKHRKLDVPAHAQRMLSTAEQHGAQANALEEIEKLLKSKKTEFAGGPHGLQAKRARAIQSHLSLVVRNKRNSIQASTMAAECHGFAAAWGGHQIRGWTRMWISQHALPSSLTGRHAKVYSLLDDPEIAMELHTYIRSNKWAMDAPMLTDFSKNRLVPVEAEKYLHGIVQNEMPQGLKCYMELDLFPHIHLKVGKGISLATAQRWLHREGFRYTSYKKGLYFDGHDRPDVVQYRQDIFLPRMKEYEA